MDQHQSYRDTDPVVNAEFLVQTPRVHPHGFRRTADLDGDLRVGVAQADQAGDSDLLRGQPKLRGDGFPFLRIEHIGQAIGLFAIFTNHARNPHPGFAGGVGLRAGPRLVQRVERRGAGAIHAAFQKIFRLVTMAAG